jgi:hypothetical protein
MVQGKSNKPDFLDGRKNGQSQITKKTNEANKQWDKMNKEMNKKFKKL